MLFLSSYIFVLQNLSSFILVFVFEPDYIVLFIFVITAKKILSNVLNQYCSSFAKDIGNFSPILEGIFPPLYNLDQMPPISPQHPVYRIGTLHRAVHT